LIEDRQAQFEQALAHHRDGRLLEAAKLYQQCLAANPDDLRTRYLLGTALLQLGQFEDSLPLLEQVAAVRPDVPDVHNNLGIACQALGRWEPAARSFETALRADPDYQQAFYNLGSLMRDRGLPADAEKCFRRAWELDSDDLSACLALAGALKQQEKWNEAESCYRIAVEREPDNSDVAVELAFILARQERLDDAADIYRRLLENHPDFHQLQSSLSYVYERQGRLDEAVATARRAIEICPDDPESHNNLGIALRSLHRLEEACDCFTAAMSLRPEFALAEFNLGTTHLLAGNYGAGWPGYRRYSETTSAGPRSFDQPQWTGGPIPGQRLFVFADQGLGDTLQFVRFLPEAAQRSQADIVLESPPELFGLLSNVPGVDVCIVEGTSPPEFDAQVPLSDLPGILDVTLTSLPGRPAYLSALPTLPVAVERLLSELPAGARTIGLVWQGNPRQARDVLRSCPLERLAPLLGIRDIAWISLQTGDAGREQLARLDVPNRPIDLGAHLTSFSETAAVIARLDLVITVDTSVAHLAGGLGHPVWTMLCRTPDWRWHLDRTDSPWYPNMTLYRQPGWGDWDAVVARIADDLRRWAIAAQQLSHHQGTKDTKKKR